MAEKKKNQFDKYIGFLWQADKEKWVNFSVALKDGKVINFVHKLRKMTHDFTGSKLDKGKSYSQLIYIDKIETITTNTEGVELKVFYE
jgi:hypothetical protein